jgi:hypothetical protein
VIGGSPVNSHPPSSWSPLTKSMSATSPVEGLTRRGPNAHAETPLTLNTQYMTPTTVVEPPTPEPPQANQKIDHTKFDLWLNENPQFTTYETRRGRSLEEPGHPSHGRPLSPLTGHHTGDPPDPPPKSGFKFSLTSNLKRLSSLSRTSISSKSVGSAGRSSHETRSPSPLSYPYPPNSGSNFPKTISMNPAALFCHEVDGQNTTMQRCIIYANKINELYLYDCGLSDWVKQMTDRSWSPFQIFMNSLIINSQMRTHKDHEDPLPDRIFTNHDIHLVRLCNLKQLSQGGQMQRQRQILHRGNTTTLSRQACLLSFRTLL